MASENENLTQSIRPKSEILGTGLGCQYCTRTRMHRNTALVRAGQGEKKKSQMGRGAALRHRQRSLRSGSGVARGTMLYRQRCLT